MSQQMLQYIFQGGYKKNNITEVVLVNATAKTLDLTPTSGKRWLVLAMRMVNADDVQRTVYIEQFNEAGATNSLGRFFIEANLAASGGTVQFPNNDDLGNVYRNAYHMVIVEDGEIIRFGWNSGGASTGSTDPDGLSCQVMEIVK